MMFLWFPERTTKDKIADVIKVINVGFVVAYFLLNTSRIFQAIELGKECLSLLNKITLEKEHRFVKLFYIVLYHIMLNGYRLINDHASALYTAEISWRYTADAEKELKRAR